jgi:3-hydroxyisobutyrate dehydrogenase-like beta-hydroxyacid dehydrogenase
MIGFIGLGVMGEPICRNLASKSGKEVRAFDIRPEPLERLKEYGVKPMASVRELAEHSEMVFLSLPGAKEVKDVCVGRASLLIHLRPGSYIIDLSTIPVSLARDLEARFAARGIHFIDAPVARTREAEINPLIVKADGVVAVDALVALAEAMTLARSAGHSATRVFETLMTGSADSFALRHHGIKALLPGEYPEQAYSVEYALKDLGYLLEFAQLTGAEMKAARNALAVLERAAAAGNGKKYFPVLAKTL